MHRKKRLKSYITPLYVPGNVTMTYCAWPTLGRLKNGKLILGMSGFRKTHVCPFGKTVLLESTDDGATWSPPAIINDTLIDDRDVGVTPSPDGGFLISWFTSDTRYFQPWFEENKPGEWDSWRNVVEAWREKDVRDNLGSFIRRIHPDGTSEAPQRVALSTPHGPVWCGHELFYIGWRFSAKNSDGSIGNAAMEACYGEAEKINTVRRGIEVHVSRNYGETWTERGLILGEPKKNSSVTYTEPTIVQTASSRLLALIRREPGLSIVQSESDDGGRNWTEPHTVISQGGPAHVLRHRSGALIMTYGYRRKPYGIRVAFSYDEGASWDADWILDEGFASDDCGYPSSIEFPDGTILTAWYRQFDGEHSGIWQAHWSMKSFK